jgi:hypothetical protein
MADRAGLNADATSVQRGGSCLAQGARRRRSHHDVMAQNSQAQPMHTTDVIAVILLTPQRATP